MEAHNLKMQFLLKQNKLQHLSFTLQVENKRKNTILGLYEGTEKEKKS